MISAPRVTVFQKQGAKCQIKTHNSQDSMSLLEPSNPITGVPEHCNINPVTGVPEYCNIAEAQEKAFNKPYKYNRVPLKGNKYVALNNL